MNETNTMEWQTLLQESAAAMGVSLSAGMTAQFMQYMQLLLEWNEKMNLTAITDPREIVLKHFADSLTPLAVPRLGLDVSAPLHVADIGTGAGFPGLPLQIAAPAWRVALMDALQKRVGFLAHVTATLGMANAECLHVRAEDAGCAEVHREQYDVVVSRAVARMQVLAEYALPLVAVGGKFIALKGPAADEEIEEAAIAIGRLGGVLAAVEDVAIPFTDLRHKLVVIQKERQTPATFPRKAAQMAKTPIK